MSEKNNLVNLYNESLKGISLVDKDGKYMLTVLGVMTVSVNRKKSFKVDRVLTPFNQSDFINEELYKLFIQALEAEIILTQKKYEICVEFPDVVPVVSCPEAKEKTVDLNDSSSYLCKLDKRKDDFIKAKDIKEIMNLLSNN